MIIDNQLLDQVSGQAKESERLRMNFNLHETLDAKAQRLLNALEVGTVLPIHRHRHTAETYILLRGHINVMFYNADGGEMVTDSSKWLKEHFQDKKDIVYYKLDACEEIPQLIKHYLDNSDEAKAIIQNGFDIVADNYVWGNIVEQLIRNV